MAVDRAMEAFRHRLELAREFRGISRREVDRRAGLSEGQTSLLERGMRPNFEATTAVLLARALDVTTDWLLSGLGPGPEGRASPLVDLRELMDETLLNGEHLEALRSALDATRPPGEPNRLWKMWDYHVEGLTLELERLKAASANHHSATNGIASRKSSTPPRDAAQRVAAEKRSSFPPKRKMATGAKRGT